MICKFYFNADSSGFCFCYCSIDHFRITFSRFLKASLGAHVSYGNDFNLHVKEISFSYERMSTKTRFEEKAKGNSEMAYSISFSEILITKLL